MTQSAMKKPVSPIDMETLFAEAARIKTTPGWIKRDVPLGWREPKTDFVPAHWKFSDTRAALSIANEVVPVELAERRTLVLRNPFESNNFATTRTGVCAYQSILPGEEAPSHRHSAHALRVILEADDIYSTVNGEHVPMRPGDVVLTPGGFWHAHKHEGAKPGFWVDYLDVPLVHLLEPMFSENHPDGYEEIKNVVEDSVLIFKSDAIIASLAKAEADPDGRWGKRITLDAPDMPDMGLTVQALVAGEGTRSWRSSANRVFVVMEGTGTSKIGDQTFEWSRGDVMVAPIWTAFSHSASSDARIFEASDEPLMKFVRMYQSELL